MSDEHYIFNMEFRRQFRTKLDSELFDQTSVQTEWWVRAIARVLVLDPLRVALFWQTSMRAGDEFYPEIE